MIIMQTLFRLIIFGALIGGVYYVVYKVPDKSKPAFLSQQNFNRTKNIVIAAAQKEVSNVLGIATQSVGKMVVKNASQVLLQQIQKLPKEQREEIKNALCK